MDPNYKPPSSLNVENLSSRKPSPRFSMATNVATTPGHSPVYYTVNFSIFW